MDLDTLKIFVETARRLSFAGVAQDRGVDPSSISRVVGRLEEELGVRLFQRTTRRMSLTEAGALFRRRAEEMLDSFEQARDEAASVAATPSGVLRLTASTAFGERMIAPLVPAFREKYPAIALDLLFTDSVLDLVAENIDLAIRLGARLEGGFVATRLRATRYRVCATPTYVAAHGPFRRPKELNEDACLRYALPGFGARWRFRARSAVADEAVIVEPAGAIAASSPLSLRSLAVAGVGPALLADWLIEDDLRAGALVDLFPDFDVAVTDFETSAWLVFPSRRYVPEKTRVMIDFLKARLC
ncbi:MAG: LysR family transcriptional regulator [Pseudomonadota bacterium]